MTEFTLPHALPPEKDFKLMGKHCQVVPLEIYDKDNKPSRHVKELFSAIKGHDELWKFMLIGPYVDELDLANAFSEVLLGKIQGFLPGTNFIMAIEAPVDETSTPKTLGTFSFLHIRPAVGVVEIGFVLFSPAMQRSVIGTEATYLMMKYVFETLGYRRLEWTLNNENSKSHAAAKRFGFTYEGLFRQNLIVKGKNRDEGWYSILDKEWFGSNDNTSMTNGHDQKLPKATASSRGLRYCYELWLDESNFTTTHVTADGDGNLQQPHRVMIQKQSLRDIISAHKGK